MFDKDYFDRMRAELIKPSVMDEVYDAMMKDLRLSILESDKQLEAGWKRIRELFEEEKRRDNTSR